MSTNDIFVAVAAGNLQSVQSLLDKGADPNAENPNGVTVLKATIVGKLMWHPVSSVTPRQEHAEIIELLLERGANLNHKASDGLTPLMTAVLMRDNKIVKLLLKAGADLEIVNSDGLTAWDMARRSMYTEIMDAIEAADKERQKQRQKREYSEQKQRNFESSKEIAVRRREILKQKRPADPFKRKPS